MARRTTTFAELEVRLEMAKKKHAADLWLAMLRELAAKLDAVWIGPGRS